MKLSAQEEFGLRCLLRLGREPEGRSLTIGELSRSEAISPANVAKIMRVLRKGGLVTSTRGKEGGYTLARPAEAIAVGEVLAVLGGRIFDSRFCDRHAGELDACTHNTDCSIRSVWRLIQGAIDQVLGALTLKDLLCREQDLRGGAPAGPRAVPIAFTPRQVS